MFNFFEEIVGCKEIAITIRTPERIVLQTEIPVDLEGECGVGLLEAEIPCVADRVALHKAKVRMVNGDPVPSRWVGSGFEKAITKKIQTWKKMDMLSVPEHKRTPIDWQSIDAAIDVTINNLFALAAGEDSEPVDVCAEYLRRFTTKICQKNPQ